MNVLTVLLYLWYSWDFSRVYMCRNDSMDVVFVWPLSMYRNHVGVCPFASGAYEVVYSTRGMEYLQKRKQKQYLQKRKQGLKIIVLKV